MVLLGSKTVFAKTVNDIYNVNFFLFMIFLSTLLSVFVILFFQNLYNWPYFPSCQLFSYTFYFNFLDVLVYLLKSSKHKDNFYVPKVVIWNYQKPPAVAEEICKLRVLLYTNIQATTHLLL